jgi:single-stranded-DNA-specific exonuclease
LLKDIDRQLDAGTVFNASSDAAAVFAGRGWHPGVVGLAAGRLCERLVRPVVVLSVADDGTAHGSARAPEGACNLYDVLAACSGLLSRFGGHSAAAGLALSEDDIPAFRKAFADECLRRIGKVRAVRTLDVAGALAASEVTPDLMRALHRLEPFGAGNETPLWAFEGVGLWMSVIGRDRTHLRLSLRRQDGLNLSAVWFGGAKYEKELQSCALWDIVGELSVNEFRGDTEIQLLVRDARPAR